MKVYPSVIKNESLCSHCHSKSDNDIIGQDLNTEKKLTIMLKGPFWTANYHPTCPLRCFSIHLQYLMAL